MADERVQQLLDAVKSRQLSRRAVLKRATALGLAAPVVAGLLADSDDTPQPTPISESVGGAGVDAYPTHDEGGYALDEGEQTHRCI